MMLGILKVLLWLQLMLTEVLNTPINKVTENIGSYDPVFERKIVEKDRQDGYWVESFHSEINGSIELIAYGLGVGEIRIYQNLSSTKESNKGMLIQKLDSPVAMDQADITKDGFNDIIICYQYGKTMLDNDPDGGKIIWLENPGKTSDNKPWKRHYVGKSTAMHRLRVGYFTQKQHLEIIGLPIVSRSFDLFSPVPVLLFRQPDNLFNASEWHREIINDNFFSVIHDAVKIKEHQLDSLLIASNEGINWLYFDEQSSRSWQIKHIGDGATEQKQHIGFHGTGGMDIGRVKNDPFAYIPAVEPFHGNVVSVYVKETNSSLNQSEWKRYLLDIFGYPNTNGESSAHYIVCADFDKDGDDEFLVALRGPAPNQGVFFYKPIDISRGLFSKWKVSEDSSARIAIGDYDNDKSLDFATTTYTVAGYYEEANPSISIYYNRFAPKQIEIKKQIQVTKEKNDLIFKVPKPNQATSYDEVQFMSINNINISLVILPPYSSRLINRETYVKVLYGTINWIDSAKGTQASVNHSRTPFIKPRAIANLVVDSDDYRVKTGESGALLMIFDTPVSGVKHVEDMKNLTIENLLSADYPKDTRDINFEFKRYDTYDSSPFFQGLEFYNMNGIGINFADDNQQLCYLQFWTAGQGVNAGVHNHRNDKFCEVHVTLVHGSSEGGMHFLKSSADVYIPNKTLDSEFQKLPLPLFYEHGPLWDLDTNNKPVLRSDGTVVYPWHKWQAGVNPSLKQSFDIWLVYEFNSQYSALPSTSGSKQCSISSVTNVAFAIFIIYSFFMFTH